MTNENQIPSETEAPVAGEPEPNVPSGPTFQELGLRPELLRALTDMGFERPMKVQAETIPRVRTRRDLMVQSRTGSGKTAGFGIPLLDQVVKPEEKFVQAIVLLPTRELALQVAAELSRIAAHLDVAIVPVYGGAPMGKQIEQLRAGGQIVCGTPGRVLDHLRRGTLTLDRVKCAVLDECDEMLSMGFQEDIEDILEKTPTSRQTLLFSATVPEGIQRLSRRFLRDPEFVKLSADFVGVHEIRHVYYSIPGGQRENELLRVLAFEDPDRAIIFCNTREETGRVAEHLRRQGFDAEAISSDLSQSDRERVMARMRAGGIKFLVATDVAARGIDIESLPAVINYTFPDSPESYIHRTGRTGRAGRQGTAISLIGPTEVGSFYYLKLLYKIKPEERSLPSEAEIRSKREGERILELRATFKADPGAEWRSLARRLVSSVDGERLIAGLLAQTLAETPVKAARASRSEPEAAAPVAERPRRRDERPEARDRGEGRDRAEFRDRGEGRDRVESRERPEARDRGERRDRPERRDRWERERDRARASRPTTETAERTEPPASAAPRAEAPAAPPEREERAAAPEPRERPERAERPERDRGERTERDRTDRGERRPRGDRGSNGRSPAAPRAATAAGGDTREFWEVWSDEVGRTPAAAAPESGSTWTADAPAVPSPGEPAEPARGGGGARLYVNLGRKDGASTEEIVSLLQTEGVSVPAADVEVMNTHTYVNVDAGDADRLCAALSGRDRDGRALVCERARPPRRR